MRNNDNRGWETSSQYGSGEYNPRAHYIQMIVNKIFNAFRHTPEFVLDVGKAITEKAERELRHNKIHTERNKSHE